MPTREDAAFDLDILADLPFERDLSAWLAGAALSSVTWTVSSTALVESHGPSILAGNQAARVWLKGLGSTGETYVTCRFTANDGRIDARSWLITVIQR